MYKYRDIFYKQYFSSQAGKADPSAFAKIFKEQKWCFAKEIIPLFPKNKNVEILDIGSGIGSLIMAAKENGYNNIIGIDISAEQVMIANKLGVGEVTEGNLNDLINKSEKKFDLITGMDIIEHFSKDELVELIIKLKKLLSENGMVIFRTPNTDAHLGTVFANGDFTHECLLNKSSALQLMKSCGYKNIEVLPSNISMKNSFKEVLRAILWFFVKLFLKVSLFSTARTWHQVVFTPNLIIKANK
ncbi:MAG: class I SAM-dependent methyltransferase [Bacteroidia bacterium]|nr:class I SAM-dependent methyltransferase [Bacteroidia bacterium]